MSISRSYLELITQFSVFEFQKYDYEFSDQALEISYDFAIPNLAEFHPTWSIPLHNNNAAQAIDREVLDNLIFSLGMIELVSYWKLTCAPQIEVLCGQLDIEQITWWTKLYKQGLGEFFYVNGIDANKVELNITVQAGSDPTQDAKLQMGSDPNSVLVPVGGGKDSAVTIELLKTRYNVVPYMINPRPASLETVKVAGLSTPLTLIAQRTMDSKLFELNSQGYLNGHTPFSALVAFSSVLTAYLNSIGAIALSNESSANEPTIAESTVNHQYSKSFEFENDFRQYERDYLHSGVDYFSLLRPLNELQIAEKFSHYPQYFPIFRSCNVGEQTNTWCGRCAKCLFVYVILSPFLTEEQLAKIFGKNLLKDKSLQPLLDELSGATPNKPFECVGSRREVQAVLTKDKNELQSLLSANNQEHKVPTDILRLLGLGR